MVGWLYALILLPVAAWLTAFGYETWLALGRSETGNFKKGDAYVHASWEITHTLLVYAFTVFLISHADSLSLLDTALFLPVCVFMIALILRGCLYLYLFYGENIKWPQLCYNLFAITHVVSIVAILSGAVNVAFIIMTFSIQPSTDHLPIVTVGFVLTAAVCAVPIWAAYHQKK